MEPSLAGLLFAIGMLALYAEFNHPGAVVPGVIGFIAILVALFAMHLLPTRYESLALLAGAFVLFALEAKMQTHGVLTAGGILMMILGMLLLVDGPIPEMRVKLWAALAISIPIGLITAFLMSIAIQEGRNQPNRDTNGQRRPQLDSHLRDGAVDQKEHAQDHHEDAAGREHAMSLHLGLECEQYERARQQS